MSRRQYNLPALTSLSVFETAARHLSFKHAAHELGVTPGAVSHQIKSLEADLGAPLFRRQHRGVELTDDGLALFEALAASFLRVSRCLEDIRQRDITRYVTVGSTTAVAGLWLSPSIIRFWRDFPDINVNQISNDRPFSVMDELDFFIRYGKDKDSGLEHTALYRDQLVPVASPELAQSLGGVSLSDIAAMRLIHLKSADRSWTNWADWFAALGHHGKVGAGPQVTSYAVALQLARKGAGVALGWRRLIDPALKSGRLVVLGDASLPAPKKFYLLGRADAQQTADALALETWLLDEIKSSESNKFQVN